MFLLVTFFLYLVKESIKKFVRTVPNLILLLSGLLLLLLLIFGNKELIKIGVDIGWTAYPPLSELSDIRTSV
jgi:heme/copper-type cytochrome/quinol oxidase subunit 1